MLTQKELAEAIEKAGLSRESSDGRVSLQLKAATDTIVSPDPGASFVDTSVAAPSWTHVLRGLMPTIPVSGAGSVTTFSMGGQGGPAIVDEDGAKPQFSTKFTASTLPLVPIAGIEKVSEEAISDIPQLIKTAEAYARTRKDIVAIGEIFMGSGDIPGLMLGNVGTANPATGSSPNFSRIMNAIQQIMVSGFSPTAIVMGASGYSSIFGRTLLSYETTYGNSSAAPASSAITDIGSPYGFSLISFEKAFGRMRPHIAGLPVIVLPTPTQWCLVGDFSEGAAIYSSGEKLEIGRDDADFSHDRFTLRIVERMNVVMRNRSAFMRFQPSTA